MYSLYHSKSCNLHQQVCIVASGQALQQPCSFPGRFRAHIDKTGRRRKQKTVHSHRMNRLCTSWLSLLGRSRPTADLASLPPSLPGLGRTYISLLRRQSQLDRDAVDWSKRSKRCLAATMPFLRHLADASVFRCARRVSYFDAVHPRLGNGSDTEHGTV